MSNKPTILLAEDDYNLGFMTKEGLEDAGFAVQWCQNGEDAWRAFGGQDICLIDIMMPMMDGFTLAEKIRDKDNAIPILFLTAKSREEDRLKGFQIGGDDYITKPFSLKELVFRLHVFLKRQPSLSYKTNGLAFGKCKYDSANLKLTVCEHSHALTQREGDILLLLLQHRNELVKREEILMKIWGANDYFMGRSLDVFISRLRKYMRADDSVALKNHHGVGFVLSDKK